MFWWYRDFLDVFCVRRVCVFVMIDLNKDKNDT